MKLAPIVLFVYNRPEHTRQTLKALKKNGLAGESVLYIYADGAKPKATIEELNSIRATRSVLKEEDWCGNVVVKESSYNKGLADSILDGVTETIKHNEKVIVLEDDIVVGRDFLTYMNNSLDYFKDNKKVFHINGFNNESNLQFFLNEYYFSNFMNCWGWGTWGDRWNHLIKNHKFYNDKLEADYKLLNKFNYEGVLDFNKQLQDNISEKINTWAILWFSTVFFEKGLCLTPKYSYVKNIGLDGTGVNCGDLKLNQKQLKNHDVTHLENHFKDLSFFESKFARWHLKLYYRFGDKINWLFMKNKIFKKIRKKLSK